MRTQMRSLAGLLTLTVLLLVGCNEHNPVEADQEMVLSEEASTAAQQTSNLQIPISGTIGNTTFDAVFNVTRFAVQSGQLVAQGFLSDVNIEGALPPDVLRQLLRRLTRLIIEDIIADNECTILTLETGPIDLMLLGLNVHIDPIFIKITADPDEGILGSLLCSIANLFNDGALREAANLLNQLLRLLG